MRSRAVRNWDQRRAGNISGFYTITAYVLRSFLRWEVVKRVILHNDQIQTLREMSKGILFLLLGIVVIFVVIFWLPHEVKQKSEDGKCFVCDLSSNVTADLLRTIHEYLDVDYTRYQEHLTELIDTLSNTDFDSVHTLVEEDFREEMLSGVSVHSYNAVFQRTKRRLATQQFHNVIGYLRGVLRNVHRF